MTAERVNAAEIPVQPAQKILDSVGPVIGLRIVHASYNVAGNLVTVTLPDHQIVAATDVIVSGADDAGINGTYTVATPTVDTFTYTPGGAPANPLGLADVPLPGEILVGQAHVSAIVRMPSALVVKASGGASVQVQVKVAPYQPWFDIVAAIAADSAVEFPVPYNFVRAVQALPVAGVFSVYAQGVYAQSLAGSPH